MMKPIVLLMIALLLQDVGVAQSSFSTYFRSCHVDGSTTIYDYKNDRWFFSDSTDAHERTLPASTFKIMNSLIALQTGVIKDPYEVMAWDGEDKKLFGRSMPVWNSDTDLRSAYKNSTIWFYVELARRIGRDPYRHYLDILDFGNGDLSERGTDFWNYGNFGVSPVDQIHFLVRLYDNALPFSVEAMHTVKSIMVSDSTDGSIFRDKTGWARQENKDIGWWIGYVETQGNVYFFATRITKSVLAENPDFAECRKYITKRILKEIMARNQD